MEQRCTQQQAPGLALDLLLLSHSPTFFHHSFTSFPVQAVSLSERHPCAMWWKPTNSQTRTWEWNPWVGMQVAVEGANGKRSNNSSAGFWLLQRFTKRVSQHQVHITVMMDCESPAEHKAPPVRAAVSGHNTQRCHQPLPRHQDPAEPCLYTGGTSRHPRPQ